MALDVYHAFLPSLGKTDSEELLPDDGSPLFENLLDDVRFAELRRLFDGPAPEEEPMDACCHGSDGDDREDIVERTILIPVITDGADRSLPWLPAGAGPWQHVDAA